MFLSKTSLHPVELRRFPALPVRPFEANDTPNGPLVVGQIMTPLKDTVIVDAKMDIESLATLLLERGLNCVAVRDARGTITGFVSMADLVREHHLNGGTEDESPTRVLSKRARRVAWGFHITKRPRATVKSIMMPFLLSVPADSPIERAAALMAFEGVHRLLVLSPRYEVTGIVSALDVMRSQAKRAGYAIPDYTRSEWRHFCEYAT
jgi:CBS-domain-containing membrane protein